MIEYIKSLKWIDYFFFCLVDPRKLIGLISRKEGNPFIISSIVVLTVSLIEIISISMVGSETQFFYFKLSYGWIFTFLVFALGIIVISSLIDFFCQFRDHNGNVKQIINLISISFFPRCFLLPLVIIFKVLNFAPIFFYIFISFVILIWQAMIIIQGISETHQTGFGESIVMFLSPFISLGIILFFLVILFLINIFGYISIV